MTEEIIVGLLLTVAVIVGLLMLAIVLVVMYEIGRWVVRKVHDKVFRRGVLK